MRVWKPAIWISAILLPGAVGVWLYSRRGQPPQVRVAPATERRLETTYTADGVVRGVTTRVAARVVARIESVLVDEGDSVDEGQVLVRLTDEDVLARIRSAAAAVASATSVRLQTQSALAAAEARVVASEKTAQARLDAANARLNQAMTGPREQEVELARHKVESARVALDEASKSAKRARNLFEAGAISLASCEAAETRAALAKQELEAAADAYDLVRAGPRSVDIALEVRDVEVAQSALEEARAGRKQLDVHRLEVAVAETRVQEAASALAVARAALVDLVLTSPTPGRILRRHLERGDIATPATPILEIVDVRGAEIEGELGDADVGKAAVGDEVTVTAANFPGREFRGRITQVAASGELKPDVVVRTRIVRIRVRLLDPDPGLKVGTQVDIEGKSATAVPVLVVPSESLAFRGDDLAVWVVSEGRAIRVPVRVGRTTPQWIEVLEGVRAGDQVVVEGKDGLLSGNAVRVVGS